MSRINWDKWGIFLSPLEDTVYLAHIGRRNGKIVVADDKKDVTNEFFHIMISMLQRNEGELILYVDGKPKYRIVLEEITSNEDVHRCDALSDCGMVEARFSDHSPIRCNNPDNDAQ